MSSMTLASTRSHANNMSRTKLYDIPRQFVTLRLSKAEWKAFGKLAKDAKLNQTLLATAIIGRAIAVFTAKNK